MIGKVYIELLSGECNLCFPTGLQVQNITDDNLDVYVVNPEGEQFYMCLFTPDNIRRLMKQWNKTWFTAADMVVVRDLRLETIVEAVEDIIQSGELPDLAAPIGVVRNEDGSLISLGERLTIDQSGYTPELVEWLVPEQELREAITGHGIRLETADDLEFLALKFSTSVASIVERLIAYDLMRMVLK